MTSAYPAPVAELLPRARELAESLGAVPSRNKLMTEFRIGATKARAVLAALTDPDRAAEVTTPASTAGPVRLHLVNPDTDPGTDPGPATPTGEPGDPPPATVAVVEEQVTHAVNPGTPTAPPATPEAAPGAVRRGAVRSWPVLLLAAPAMVAIWSGWVGLGGLTGFGVVHPLPGIWDALRLNTAITLPIGVETYAAFALRVWLSGRVPPRARRFAAISALGSLLLGAAGQVAYHLMTAARFTEAPWPITTAVACLPVAVLGMGAALAHLIRSDES